MDQATRKRLVDRILAGDEAAWQGYVREGFRTVATFMARVVQEPDLAGRLTSQTFARALEHLPELVTSPRSSAGWLLLQARDACFDLLPAERWRATGLNQGQELFGGPPHLRPLPAPVLDSDGDMDRGLLVALYDQLKPEHQLFFELAFVERVPLAEVAELFAITENLARSFFFSIVSPLGDFDGLPHGPDCRPDLFLCVDAQARMGAPEELKALMREVQACPSCRRVLFRSVRLFALFAHDTRPDVAPAQRLLEELAPRNRRSAKGKVTTFVPIPVRHAPHRASVLLRAVAPAFIVAGFIWGAWSLLQGNLLPYLTPHQPRDSVRRQKDLLQGLIGGVTGAAGGRTPLFEGMEVFAPARRETTLEYASGDRVTLQGGATLQARLDGATLVRGTAELQLADGRAAPFVLGCQGMEVSAVGKHLFVATLPGRGTTVGVVAGRAEVRLANGTALTVEQDHQVTIRPDGTYDVRAGGVDRPRQELAAPLPAPSGAPRRPGFTGLRSQGSVIHVSPDVNPPRTFRQGGGSGQGDAGGPVHGYKDYF